jgi:hypothetical protein
MTAAATKLYRFMKSLTPNERGKVWNIFYRQVNSEKPISGTRGRWTK